jgi:hypothetical protein
MKLLLTNVCYGETYAHIFLNHHLGSLLDETNIPSMHKDVTYIIFTDNETMPILKKHPNMIKLLSLCEVEFRDFSWRPDANRFSLRYSLLVNTFRQSVEEALRRECALSAWCADLVFAKNFLPGVMTAMAKGHDAVFVLPARSTAEAMEALLPQEGALDADQLWKHCHENMHPLFLAAHYSSPTFTKYPYYLLWNTGVGLMARSFSLTPIVFKPNQDMVHTKHVIDIEVPGQFKNPYWCTDWDDAPVIGVEPVTCYLTCSTNFPANIERLGKFASQRHPSQLPFLKQRLYYPNRLVANVSPRTIEASDSVVEEVLWWAKKFKSASPEHSGSTQVTGPSR